MMSSLWFNRGITQLKLQGRTIADMQQIHGTNLTLVVVETKERGVLLSGAQRACNSLNCRTDISVPKLDVVCIDPTPSKLGTAIQAVPRGTIVVACIKPMSGLQSAVAIGKTINAAGAKFTVAEQSVGSPQSAFSAGQILSLVYHGVTAVFREYDFIAEDTVLQLLLEHNRRARAKAVLVGEPANRVKSLLEEVKLEWNDPDTGMVYRPEVTFRLACALTQIPGLDPALNTYEKIAYELNHQGWFLYNIEDTRKAIGSLTRIWGLNKRILYLLPYEARKRGFPNLDKADILFDFIENIDTDERIFTSASGNQFGILYVSEI